MKRSGYWILPLLALYTLTTLGQAQPSNEKVPNYNVIWAGKNDRTREIANAEKFLVDHKDADPFVLTQVYRFLFVSYVFDSNWTKVLETYDRINLEKLTDEEKDQFAKIAEIARTRLR
jgi:hypothetical protein